MKVGPGGSGGSGSGQPENIRRGQFGGRNVRVELPSEVSDYVHDKLKDVDLEEALPLASQFYAICGDDLAQFEEIVRLISGFPKGDQERTLTLIPQAWLDQCEDGQAVKMVLWGVSQLPPDRIESTFRAFPEEIIAKCSSGQQLAMLLQVVSNFPDCHKAIKAIPKEWIEKCRDGMQVVMLLKATLAIPTELLINIPQRYFDQCHDGIELANVLCGVVKIPPHLVIATLTAIPEACFTKYRSQPQRLFEVALRLEPEKFQVFAQRFVEECQDIKAFEDRIEGVAKVLEMLPERYTVRFQSPSDLVYLFDGLAQLPPNRLQEIVELIPEAFISKCSSIADLIELVGAIRKIRLDRVRESIKAISSRYVAQCEDGENIGRFLTEVTTLLPPHLLGILEEIPQPYLERCYGSSDLLQLLTSVCGLPVARYRNILRDIPQLFINRCNGGYDLATLLECVSRLPPTRYKKILQIIPPDYLDLCEDIVAVGEVLVGVSFLPAQRSRNLIEAIPYELFQKCKTCFDLKALLGGVSLVRVRTLREMRGAFPAAMLDKCQNGVEAAKLLTVASGLQQGKIHASLHAIPEIYVERCANGTDIADLIFGLEEVPFEQFPEVFDAIPQWVNSAYINIKEISGLIAGIAKLPAGQRKEIFDVIPVPIIEKCRNNGGFANLLSGVAKLPTDRLAAIFAAIPQKYIDMCENGLDLEGFFTSVTKLPVDEIHQTLETIPQLLFGVCRKGIDFEMLIDDVVKYGLPTLIAFSELLATKMSLFGNRLEVLQIAIDLSEGSVETFQMLLTTLGDSPQRFTSPEQVLAYCLSKQEDLRAAALRGMSGSDAEVAKRLSILISSKIALNETDLLMQMAIEVRAQFEIPTLKNPYALHHKLKELSRLPSAYRPPFESGIAFNPEVICEAAQIFSISIQEIPQGFKLEKWMSLVNKLHQKGAQINAEEMTGYSFEILWTEVFNHHYIKGLFQYETHLSITQAQFASIFHTILAQDDSAPANALLSPQEEMLLKIAAGIASCETGKKEGIANTYAQLPSEFKLKKNLEAMTSTDEDRQVLPAKEALSCHVQAFLIDQFSGTTPLAQELTGASEPAQGVHQGLYMKNLIGPLVGLNHQVSFDRHTGVLYDALVLMSREGILEAFYRHIKPQHLVHYVHQRLLKELDMTTKEGKALFNSLNALVGSSKELWDESDYTLTEPGTRTLLKTVGFLSSL